MKTRTERYLDVVEDNTEAVPKTHLVQDIISLNTRLAALERECSDQGKVTDAMQKRFWHHHKRILALEQQVGDSSAQYCTCDSKGGTVTHEDSVRIIHEYCRDCHKEIGQEKGDGCPDTAPEPRDDREMVERYSKRFKFIFDCSPVFQSAMIAESVTDLIQEARRTA